MASFAVKRWWRDLRAAAEAGTVEDRKKVIQRAFSQLGEPEWNESPRIRAVRDFVCSERGEDEDLPVIRDDGTEG